jgi:hypothetical protein
MPYKEEINGFDIMHKLGEITHDLWSTDTPQD